MCVPLNSVEMVSSRNTSRLQGEGTEVLRREEKNYAEALRPGCSLESPGSLSNHPSLSWPGPVSQSYWMVGPGHQHFLHFLFPEPDLHRECFRDQAPQRGEFLRVPSPVLAVQWSLHTSQPNRRAWRCGSQRVGWKLNYDPL